jgi:hypothetical protein
MVTHPEGEADNDRLCYRYLQQRQQFSFLFAVAQFEGRFALWDCQ